MKDQIQQLNDKKRLW